MRAGTRWLAGSLAICISLLLHNFYIDYEVDADWYYVSWETTAFESEPEARWVAEHMVGDYSENLETARKYLRNRGATVGMIPAMDLSYIPARERKQAQERARERGLWFGLVLPLALFGLGLWFIYPNIQLVMRQSLGAALARKRGQAQVLREARLSTTLPTMSEAIEPRDNVKRPGWVWVISIFFFVSAGYTLLSLALFAGGSVYLAPAQKAYFSSLSFFDYATSVAIACINFTGAVLLFRLRHLAPIFFLSGFVLGLLYSAYHIATTQFLASIGGPGLVGAAIGQLLQVFIVLYSFRLRRRGVLS